MKRFHTPLLRLLRLREQKERMAQLQLAKARTAVDEAGARLKEAQLAWEQRAALLEATLRQPGLSLVVQQALFEWESGESAIRVCQATCADANERLQEQISAYRVARQEREIIERVVEMRREEHRRETMRAAAVNLQEWAVRPAYAFVAAEEQGVDHA